MPTDEIILLSKSTTTATTTQMLDLQRNRLVCASPRTRNSKPISRNTRLDTSGHTYNPGNGNDNDSGEDNQNKNPFQIKMAKIE